jgi:DNA-binding transcriptional regulator YhcF (GntR family)
MNEDGGYVRIYRRLYDNPVFKGPWEAAAFAFLISKAAWRPIKVRYKGREVTLQRGQLVMSVRDFARHMNRDRNWASRFLQLITNRDMIETVTETGITVITICKYEEYQENRIRAETVVELHPRQSRDSTETQNKEEKEWKEGKERKKGSPLPEWMPLEAWSGWLDMRRRIRKPATDRAVTLAIVELAKLKERGHDPAKVLDQSTLKGWTSFYPVRGDVMSDDRITI